VNQEVKASLKSFCVELLVYSVLVAGYFFLVLHVLGNWLQHLFEHDRRLYAGIALGLIIGQGVALEVLTRSLLKFIKRGEVE
jgi:hypothetical protein